TAPGHRLAGADRGADRGRWGLAGAPDLGDGAALPRRCWRRRPRLRRGRAGSAAGRKRYSATDGGTAVAGRRGSPRRRRFRRPRQRGPAAAEERLGSGPASRAVALAIGGAERRSRATKPRRAPARRAIASLETTASERRWRRWSAGLIVMRARATDRVGEHLCYGKTRWQGTTSFWSQDFSASATSAR